MLFYLLPFILRMIRFDQFKSRNLTSGEIKLCSKSLLT